MDPANLKYAKSHEWVSVEGDVATVGITEFAVKQLNDLVFIELPETGRQLAVGDEFGVIESVKAASDLYAPVAGEIIESNTGLEDDLDPLSEDAFGKGWMVKIKVSNPGDLDALMDQAAYNAHCESEAH